MRLRSWVLSVVLLGMGLPQVAHAQTPAQQAAAEQLVAELKLGELMQASTATMIDAQVRQNPLLAPYRNVMVEWARRYVTTGAALPEFAKVYAAAFTEAELRALLDFYRSPVGQKLVAQQPQLLQQGAAIGERLGQEHQAELMQMVQARAAELQQDSTSAK